MRRRLPWVLGLLLVLVIGGAVALVVTARPALDDDRTAVDARWAPLRDALTDRYAKLEEASAALTAAGAGDRSVATALRESLTAWNEAVADGSADTETEAANRLEGVATRLRANVLASARLVGVADLVAAIAAYDGSAPPAARVRAYNSAVRSYEDDRNDSFKKPVARLLGYDARPVLVIDR